MNVSVHGFVEPGFQPVWDTFARSLASGEERGGAVAVTHRGRLVVDLWGGEARRSTPSEAGAPWRADTLACVFSATKGMAALALLRLHEAGAFDYDAPVAHYWPGFGQAGKAQISVRTLLNHRAGLPALDTKLSLEQFTEPGRWPEVVEAMERQRPAFRPGSRQAYHATTYGMYVAELFRRLSPDQDFGAYFRAHVAQPLDAEVWVGAPAERDPQICRLYPLSIKERVRRLGPELFDRGSTDGTVGRAILRPGSLVRRTFLNPEIEKMNPATYNRVPARRSALLWASGVASARGLAKVYAPLANEGEAFGVRLCAPRSLEPLYLRQSWSERDRIMSKPMGWSQGFLKEQTGLFSPNPQAFGHAGLGGALGWADPVARTSFGYVTNTMGWRVRPTRCLDLCQAVYASPGLRA